MFLVSKCCSEVPACYGWWGVSLLHKIKPFPKNPFFTVLLFLGMKMTMKRILKVTYRTYTLINITVLIYDIKITSFTVESDTPRTPKFTKQSPRQNGRITPRKNYVSILEKNDVIMKETCFVDKNKAKDDVWKFENNDIWYSKTRVFCSTLSKAVIFTTFLRSSVLNVKIFS